VPAHAASLVQQDNASALFLKVVRREQATPARTHHDNIRIDIWFH